MFFVPFKTETSPNFLQRTLFQQKYSDFKAISIVREEKNKQNDESNWSSQCFYLFFSRF